MDEKRELTQWVPDGELVAGVKEVLLLLFLVDDSSSIEGAGNTQPVIDGYNNFLNEIRGAPGQVRSKIMFLHSDSEGGFVPPADVTLLSRDNYRPHGDTPLYLRSTVALVNIIEEAKRLTAEGYTVRTMTLIFTDGGDNDSRGIFASDVKTMVDEMLATGVHIVGGCAVSDGHTNFWQVFASMGIPEHWIKVLKGGAEIGKSMTEMGRTAAGASRSAADYDRTTQTGYGQTHPDN